MIKMIKLLLLYTNSKLWASGIVEFSHINEAPTVLVKHVAAGLHRWYISVPQLITQYTPYFHREALETLPKGGMTL